MEGTVLASEMTASQGHAWASRNPQGLGHETYVALQFAIM